MKSLKLFIPIVGIIWVVNNVNKNYSKKITIIAHIFQMLCFAGVGRIIGYYISK